ncbi:MAG: DNA polymerase III subunit delta, partial [Alphaproteobacteria bacterium]|nr:DNA polymerase III subunit delta [Alphaproteobacteria bacterium]
VIRDHFRNECVEVSNDAIGYLATHMGSSRGTTRAELEKLVLYAGNSKRLSLEDVTEAIGDTSAFSIDMAVNAAMSGEAKKLDLVLDKLWEDSISPVALIRAATGHLLKIQKVQANMEEGMGLNDAVSALRPPIFWKIKDQFGRQCKLWNKFICAKALTILLDAERNCKKTNIPAETITARAFQQLAAYARQSGRR